MAVFAELEHDMIREYTMDGLVSDRPQGGTGSRLTVMDADTLVAVRAARANNESLRLDRQSTGSPPMHLFTATCPPATPEPRRPNRFFSANHCSDTDQAPSRRGSL